MKLAMLAVRDRQLDAFMRPFCVQTIGQGIRSFGDEVQRQDQPMYQHPEDYELYHLGDFDEETGKLTSLDKPKQIALATQFKQLAH